MDVLQSPVAERIVQRAHELRDEVVAELIGIAQVPAPTFHEERRALHVLERMRAAGLVDLEIDAVGNVVGRLPGQSREARPRILVAAHLDTVFPMETDVTVRFEGDLLRGPGVGDNAAGVAVLLWAPRLLREVAGTLPADVLVAGTVGEEGLGNLRGMRALMERFGDQVDAVIALDGSLGGLVRQGVGSRRLRIQVETEGGHSWGAFGNPSAIHVLCRIVSRITEIPVPKDPKTTYNVGLIEGGTAVNAIAAHAAAVIDLRSVDGASLSRLEARVREIAARQAAQAGATVHISVVGDRPVGSIPEDHPLCRAVMRAHERLGIQTRIYPSSTDANIPLAGSIPAVTIGVTLGGNGHRLDEYIQIPPLSTGLAQVALVLLALQGAPLSAPVR
ncbi:M20/M25/M40 family metallo-hydrolase [Caldinitratiruptor microaerophilus]|uniref:Peptidase M20 n=1 Tax=Caldinitratiruptor microaerophilus TaxID=671077 RepID=A0AA35CHY0_9FIRM|nr:M20/M25/M40 family metallo-hydrolase [Caldinitratiruptor microaerophilus]BDG59339.1 peptidase M20 [Caldinitratiruptor microaerophilus]